MVTFHIKLDYLESVEIVLSALQECSDPDARAIADGILRTLIRVEDGIATHLGGHKLPLIPPDSILTTTPDTTTTPSTTTLNTPLCKESTHLSSKCTQIEKPKHYPPLRVIQGGKHVNQKNS